DPFQYPLSEYLHYCNWTFWNGPQDTPQLLEDLSQAVVRGALSLHSSQLETDLLQPSRPAVLLPLPSAQPTALELPEATMDAESHFYGERPSDVIALEAIARQGVTITIKGPRQMGKSSLLIRAIAAARQADKRVAFLDFQLFDRTALNDADRFFRQF